MFRNFDAYVFKKTKQICHIWPRKGQPGNPDTHTQSHTPVLLPASGGLFCLFLLRRRRRRNPLAEEVFELAHFRQRLLPSGRDAVPITIILHEFCQN